jgi:pimeloyl-ACP methyl ester carboxylesterase
MALGSCFHDLSLLDGPFHAQFIVPLIGAPGRIAGAMRFLRCMEFKRIDAFAALHRELAMPTLFIWGADDPTFPVVCARAMSAQFPNVAGFHEIARTKLFLQEERPAEVAAHIARFCEA